MRFLYFYSFSLSFFFLSVLTFLFFNGSAYSQNTVPSLPSALSSQTKDDDHELQPEAATVKKQGILKHGIMAIGGETTGTGIVCEDGLFELELSRVPQLLELAKKYQGQKVEVKGQLETWEGVEIPMRKVIVVKTLTLLR